MKLTAKQWRDLEREQQRLFIRIVAVCPVFISHSLYHASLTVQVRRGTGKAGSQSRVVQHRLLLPAPYVDAHGNWLPVRGPAEYTTQAIVFTRAQVLNALTHKFLFLNVQSATAIVGMADSVLKSHLKG
jgi:hypothetical protein